MLKKNRTRNRIPSLRLSGWDYGWDGIYFITICTHSRIPHFGNIQDGKMILSDAGMIAFSTWQDIPTHFPYILLDTFVIMPDHLHGLLIIKSGNNIQNPLVRARFIAPPQNLINPSDEIKFNPPHENKFNPPHEKKSNPPLENDLIPPHKNHTISTSPDSSNQNGGITGIKNPMLHDNISRVIRWYKGRTAFEIHHDTGAMNRAPTGSNPAPTEIDFKWHRGFHDRIIKNMRQWKQTQHYIENNPLKWDDHSIP